MVGATLLLAADLWFMREFGEGEKECILQDKTLFQVTPDKFCMGKWRRCFFPQLLFLHVAGREEEDLLLSVRGETKLSIGFSGIDEHLVETLKGGSNSWLLGYD